MREFVAYAKQNPGKLNFGSAGTGGTIHLAGEMFKQMAGVDMVHVPYKGAGPGADRSVSRVNIQVMFDTLGTALPPVKGGLLRPLGSASTQRIADLPDVADHRRERLSRLPRQRLVWRCGARRACRTRSRKDHAPVFNRALDDEAFRASLDKIGFPPLRPNSQAEIDNSSLTDRTRWAGVIKSTQHITLDLEDMVRESELREGELAVDMPPPRAMPGSSSSAASARPGPRGWRRRGRAGRMARSAGWRFSSPGCPRSRASISTRTSK